MIAIDAVSRLEIDQQQAKFDTAKASVQSAQAEIAQIQVQLKDSQHQQTKAQIIAPADGIITVRNAEKGALTDSNALFQLAKNGTIELEVQPTSDELAQLQTGLQATLKNKNLNWVMCELRLTRRAVLRLENMGKCKFRCRCRMRIWLCRFRRCRMVIMV